MARADTPLADCLGELRAMMPDGGSIERFAFVVDETTNLSDGEVLSSYAAEGGATPSEFESQWQRILAGVQRDWVNLVGVAVFDGTAVVTVEHIDTPARNRPHVRHEPAAITVNLSWYTDRPGHRVLIVPADDVTLGAIAKTNGTRLLVASLLMFALGLGLFRDLRAALAGGLVTAAVLWFMYQRPNTVSRRLRSKVIRDEVDAVRKENIRTGRRTYDEDDT